MSHLDVRFRIGTLMTLIGVGGAVIGSIAVLGRPAGTHFDVMPALGVLFVAMVVGPPSFVAANLTLRDHRHRLGGGRFHRLRMPLGTSEESDGATEDPSQRRPVSRDGSGWCCAGLPILVVVGSVVLGIGMVRNGQAGGAIFVFVAPLYLKFLTMLGSDLLRGGRRHANLVIGTTPRHPPRSVPHDESRSRGP